MMHNLHLWFAIWTRSESLASSSSCIIHCYYPVNIENRLKKKYFQRVLISNCLWRSAGFFGLLIAARRTGVKENGQTILMLGSIGCTFQRAVIYIPVCYVISVLQYQIPPVKMKVIGTTVCVSVCGDYRANCIIMCVCCNSSLCFILSASLSGSLPLFSFILLGCIYE